MYKNKPMPLLLIEDDVADCIKFKNCVNTRTDVIFVGMTGSSSEGLKYVQTLMPEGIILDLELHRGTGSGLQFLAELKKADFSIKPIIIITTNTLSHIVYNHVRDFGVDMIFYKRQTDYCAEMVVNTMVALRKSWFVVGRDDMPRDLQTIESPEERRKRIMERIYTELDLIGIGVRYKGREYFQDAIFALINKEKNSSDAVIYQVAELRKASYSSIIRAMQTAINRTWETSAIEDLQKYYTVRVNVNTGVPSPTEFIHYYADKIRKTM